MDSSSDDTVMYAIIGAACAGVVVLVAGGYCLMRSRMSKGGSASFTNRNDDYFA